MSDPSSEDDDLRALWQAQPQEKDPMTLDHIQAISRRLDRSEQRAMFILIATTAVTAFAIGLVWQKSPDPMVRATYVLCALGMAGFIAIFLRAMRLTRDPTEPGGVYLRRRLERNLFLSSGSRTFPMVLPLAPGLISLVVVVILKNRHAPPLHLTGLQLTLNFLPLILLAAAWLVVLLIFVPRQLRRVRRDIEELDAAMK